MKTIENVFENDPSTFFEELAKEEEKLAVSYVEKGDHAVALHHRAQGYAYYRVRNLLIGYSLKIEV